MDQFDQHYNDQTYLIFKFEGTPDEFVQACLAYTISHKTDSYPFLWTQTKNKYCFTLERSGPNIDYNAADVFVSPLPKSRSDLTFRILIREFDKYNAICQKLVDYFRGLGWIKPQNDKIQKPEILPGETKSTEHKNNPRIDAVNRVAVALYTIEKGEILTYSSAAKRFKTHTETITKYSDNPSVLKMLEEFRKDPAVYQRCRQTVSKVERRK